MNATKPAGPITVQWAFVVGVFDGKVTLIDHEYAHEVKASRPATLDDIHAACFVVSKQQAEYWFIEPSAQPYTCAFVIFQMPTGQIAASPDVFEDLAPVSFPNDTQAFGAFGVLQAQIIAQKTADIAAPLAAQATLSMLRQMAPADPDAPNKTPGGLIRA